MNIRWGRAAAIALLFLGAQLVPGLHAALEAGHDLHSCCTDGERTSHFDHCKVDHDAPPCPVCASAHATTAVAPTAAAHAVTRTTLPGGAPFTEILVDPFLFAVPDTRGPPA